MQGADSGKRLQGSQVTGNFRFMGHEYYCSFFKIYKITVIFRPLRNYLP